MANFSSIKFNGVDYPLKDASAREDIAQLQETVGGAVGDIASLQTSVSGIDTRVTALEESGINNTVHTYPLPTEDDYEGQFDAGAPDSGRAYHISDELYYDLMDNDVTVLFTGSISNFVSGAQLTSNKKQGRFTLILDSGQVLEFWAYDLSDYGYGKCLCYDDDYVYGDNSPYNESAKFDTVKTRLDSSGKVVAVGFGKYPEKGISDGFSKVSGNSLESLTLDNYDYSKGYFNGSFTYNGMTIKSQPIQGFTSLPDGPRWYGYFTSTTGDILYIDSTYSEEQGGVMVTTAQIIPSGYYEVVDIDALHALIIQKGKNLPIDKPYHFTTTFTYVYYDVYEVVHQVTFLPQSTNLMLDPDAIEEDGEYRFDIFSSENKKYRINISPSGFEYVNELFIETNVALPPESAFEPYKLRNIRVNGEIGIIPSDDNYTPYCQFVDYDVDYRNVLCLWLCDVNDEDTNNEIAKSLYYGIKPVITNATEIDYTDSEGYEQVFAVAQGEVKLEKVRNYYLIHFRKPISSPDDTSSPYYSEIEQWLGRSYVLEPQLKLVDGVPKITFEIAV